jgi:hypothetical protein
VWEARRLVDESGELVKWVRRMMALGWTKTLRGPHWAGRTEVKIVVTTGLYLAENQKTRKP